MPIIPPAIVRWRLLLDGHRGGLDRERVGVRRGVARSVGGLPDPLALTPHEVEGPRGSLSGVHLDGAVLLSLRALVNAVLEPLLGRSKDIGAGELDAEGAVLDVLLASGRLFCETPCPSQVMNFETGRLESGGAKL